MSDKPRFGEWVLFTHHYDKPTQEEMEARDEELDGEEGTIARARRENPTPEAPFLIIGVCSPVQEFDLRYNAITGRFFLESDMRSGRREFYTLRRALRGKRFFAAAEDIQRGGTS